LQSTAGALGTICLLLNASHDFTLLAQFTPSAALPITIGMMLDLDAHIRKPDTNQRF
jgi:hypothetical protein